MHPRDLPVCAGAPSGQNIRTPSGSAVCTFTLGISNESRQEVHRAYLASTIAAAKRRWHCHRSQATPHQSGRGYAGGSLNGAWIPHDRRDEVVDFVNTISTKTRLPVQQVVEWCGLARGKFYDWRKRYGKVNEHNGLVPRDHWIEDWERQRVIDYFDCHPLDGYRRLTFMMLDEEVVALSPSTTYRVLSKAGRLDRWNGKPSKKGTGFVQPLRPHQHWHTDISYLNLGGTFYYLCSFLDGASRAVVHWEIRESMTEADVECILERAKELYPDARPRIISDNGPQYIAKEGWQAPLL